MGSLLGVTATEGGYVLGAIVLCVFVAIGLILTSKLRSNNMYGMVAFLSMGLALPYLFGWFPDWILVFVLMLVVGAGIAMSGALTRA